MAYNLILNSVAESDIVDSAFHHYSQRPGSGKDLLAAASETLSLLKTRPHPFAIKQDGIRSVRIKPFACCAICTVVNADVVRRFGPARKDSSAF